MQCESNAINPDTIPCCLVLYVVLLIAYHELVGKSLKNTSKNIKYSQIDPTRFFFNVEKINQMIKS